MSNDPDKRTVVIPLNGSGRGCQDEEDLGVFTHDGSTGMALKREGTMERDSCKSYSMFIEKRADLIICIPAGYDLQGNCTEYATGEVCRFQGDPTIYKRYRSLEVEEGTNITVNILRKPESPDNFTFIFRLFPR